MTRRRTLLDWSLFVAAMGSVAAWFAFGAREPVVDADSSTPFQSLKESPPQRLMISRNGRTLHLERNVTGDPETRYVVAGIADPKTAPVEPAALDRLLNSLAALEVIRDVPHPVNLKSVGLEPPLVTFAIESAGPRATIQIGGVSQSNDQGRYARLLVGDRARVVVFAPAAAAALDVAPDDLLDRRLLDLVPSEIQRLTLTTGFSRVEIEQAEDGRYWLSGTPKRRASRDRTERLLLALTELEFDPTAKSTEREPKPSDLVATLEPRESERASKYVLRFGETCAGKDAFISVTMESPVRRSGCVPSTVVALVPQTEAEWLEPRLTFFRGDEVERLSVRGDTKPFVLERDGSAFKLRAPEEREVALAAGNALLDGLTRLTGSRVGRCGDDFRRGAREIALRSGLVGHGGSTDDKIWVTEPNADGSRTVCRDDDERLVVDAQSAVLLDGFEAALRDPERLHYPFDAIDAIEIHSGHQLQRLASDEANHLTLREPNLPGDAATIESLREQLAQLTVERWVPEAVQTAHATERIIVKFWAKDATGERRGHELMIDRRPDGTGIGRLDGDPTRFLLKDALLRHFDGLLVDRSLYRLLESDVAFSLSRGKDQIDCSRTKQDFKCSSPRLTDSRLAALVEALGQLRALRTVDASHALAQASTELTLRIFTGAGTARRARFVLHFAKDSSSNGEQHWTARAGTRALTFVYDATTLAPLFHAFTADPTDADGSKIDEKPN